SVDERHGGALRRRRLRGRQRERGRRAAAGRGIPRADPGAFSGHLRSRRRDRRGMAADGHAVILSHRPRRQRCTSPPGFSQRLAAALRGGNPRTAEYRRARVMWKRIVLALSMLPLGACSSLGVQPWERDVLARPEMALDHESITLGLDDHIYFSKEASSGG